MKEKQKDNKIYFRIMKTKINDINNIRNTKHNSNEKCNLSKYIKSKKSNISKKFIVKDISLKNINNKNNDTSNNLLTNNQLNSSKFSAYKELTSKNTNLTRILNTSHIIQKAENAALYLKNSLIDSEKKYLINKKKFEKIRKQTDDINKFFRSLKYKEKEEEKNKIYNNNKSDDSIKEDEKKKIYSILNESPLLITKKNDIQTYFNQKSKSQILEDKKKIRYMNKLKEYLEILKIKNNELLDNKEKIIKIKNSKYIANYEYRLNQEYLKNQKNILKEIKKENKISLQNIKETNMTLNNINKNKSFLDDEIELKYAHSNKKVKHSFNNKITKIKDDINNGNNNKSFINNNFHILRINKLENKNDLSFIKKNKSKSYINLINNLKNHNNLKLILDNSFFEKEDDKDNNKSKMESLYDEIKDHNILNKQNRDYVENYFKKKKFILNNKPYQLMGIINQTIYNISHFNVEKKMKKVIGLYYPKNIRKHFDDLEHIDTKANQVRRKLIHSMCKSRIKINNKKLQVN